MTSSEQPWDTVGAIRHLRVLETLVRVDYLADQRRSRVCWPHSGSTGKRPLTRAATRAPMPLTEDELQSHIAADHPRLVGWFRMRVGDRDLAQDLAQRTWLELHSHRESYDPLRGTVPAFVNFWAAIILKRHHSERARRRRYEGDLPQYGEDDRNPVTEASRSWFDEVVESRDAAELAEAERWMVELLRHTLSCKRLPHEILTFLLVKVLGWTPREVVSQLTSHNLESLARLVEENYLKRVPTHAVREAFAILHQRLSCRLAEVQVDPRTRRAYAQVQDRVLATTELSAYLRSVSRPEDDVVHWWDAVKKVMLSELVKLEGSPLADWLGRRRLEGRAAVRRRSDGAQAP